MSLINAVSHNRFLNEIIIPILKNKKCEVIKIGYEDRYEKEEREKLLTMIDLCTLLIRQMPDLLVIPSEGYSFLLCAKSHDRSKYHNIAIEMLPVWISKRLGIPVLYPYIDGDREIGFWSSWIFDHIAEIDFHRTGKYETALEVAIIELTAMMPENHIKIGSNQLIQSASKDPFFIIPQGYLGIFDSWEKLIDKYLKENPCPVNA